MNQQIADTSSSTSSLSSTASSKHKTPPRRTSSRKAFIDKDVVIDDSTTPKVSPSNSLNRTSSLPLSQQHRPNPLSLATPSRSNSSSFFHNIERTSPESSATSQLNRNHSKTPSFGGLSSTNETPIQVRDSLYSEASLYSPTIEQVTQVKLSDSSARGKTVGGRKPSPPSDYKSSEDRINQARESRYSLKYLLAEMQDLRRSTSGGRPFPTSGDSTVKLSNPQYPTVSTSTEEDTYSPLFLQHNLPDLRHNVPLRTHNGHGRSFSTSTDMSNISNYPTSSYSSASQYPALLPSSTSPKLGKSSMPVMAGSISSPNPNEDHWDASKFSPPSTEDVGTLMASLDKYKPKLKDVQDKRSSMFARMPSTATSASNDTQNSSSSGFSYTSTPVKYDFPAISQETMSSNHPSTSAYSWQRKDDDLLHLSPPPIGTQLYDDRRDSQDSSNESFQTAATHSEDSDDILGRIQRQEEQHQERKHISSSSGPLPGAADLSHSSSGNTVTGPGGRRNQRNRIIQPSLSSFNSITSPLRVNTHSADEAKIKNAASLPVLVAGKEIEPVRTSIRGSMMYPQSSSEGSDGERRGSNNRESSRDRRIKDSMTYEELTSNESRSNLSKERERELDREPAKKEKVKQSRTVSQEERTHRRNHTKDRVANEDLFDNRSTGISSTSKVPRKAVFSQPNIQRLLKLAENSYNLDHIDLPPDERHLLEKFVDALSKLSVEINLDDGKRIEGKRRLHNALRAIEGWI